MDEDIDQLLEQSMHSSKVHTYMISGIYTLYCVSPDIMILHDIVYDVWLHV
jgi:hypothetical protein